MKWKTGQASVPDASRFPPMSRTIPKSADERSAQLIVQFLKDPALFARFQAKPVDTLAELGLSGEKIEAAAVNEIVLGLMTRSPSAFPVAAYDAIRQRHTETDRAKNMDNSFQYYVRYENLINVYRDQGSSRRTTTVQNQSTSKTYAGVSVAESEPGPIASTDFYPGQPLVTPSLLLQIKARLASP